MFKYIDNPSIPNNTNSLESFFGHLKDNLRIHRGMSIEHRQNFIKWYLFFCNEKKKKETEKEKEIEKEIEKEKEQTVSAPMDGRSFTEFWNLYPAGKGGDRADAWNAWKEIAPPISVAWRIIDSLKDWKTSDQWKEDGGRYIPGASKFLRERRWMASPAAYDPEEENNDGPFSESLAYANRLLAGRR